MPIVWIVPLRFVPPEPLLVRLPMSLNPPDSVVGFENVSVRSLPVPFRPFEKLAALPISVVPPLSTTASSYVCVPSVWIVPFR